MFSCLHTAGQIIGWLVLGLPVWKMGKKPAAIVTSKGLSARNGTLLLTALVHEPSISFIALTYNRKENEIYLYILLGHHCGLTRSFGPQRTCDTDVQSAMPRSQARHLGTSSAMYTTKQRKIVFFYKITQFLDSDEY